MNLLSSFQFPFSVSASSLFSLPKLLKNTGATRVKKLTIAVAVVLNASFWCFIGVISVIGLLVDAVMIFPILSLVFTALFVTYVVVDAFLDEREHEEEDKERTPRCNLSPRRLSMLSLRQNRRRRIRRHG